MDACPPIYFLTHEFTPFRGGVATYVREAAAAARESGYDVRVLAPDYRGAASPAPLRVRTETGEVEVPVERFRGGGRLNGRGVAELAWGIRQRRAALADAPVVALSAGALMALIALDRARVFQPRRLLPFFHGSEILKLTRRWFWRRCAPAFFARWPHAAAASRYVAALLEKSDWRWDATKIHLAPCACSGAFVRGVMPAAAPTPPAGDGLLRVLSVARLHPRKGQLDLARALGDLPEALRSRVVLQLAGVGSATYRRQIEAACRAAGVSLEILGNVPDARLPALYADCDVFVQASRALPESVEGFGITYLEAAAGGRPVIAYDSGGTPEAVLDGRTGLLVREGDLPALTGAFARLLESPELRRRLGEAGREHARTFHWQKAARVLCEAALAAEPAR